MLIYPTCCNKIGTLCEKRLCCTKWSSPPPPSTPPARPPPNPICSRARALNLVLGWGDCLGRPQGAVGFSTNSCFLKIDQHRGESTWVDGEGVGRRESSASSCEVSHPGSRSCSCLKKRKRRAQPPARLQPAEQQHDCCAIANCNCAHRATKATTVLAQDHCFSDDLSE